MASIQETLRAALTADSTVTALVGDRIYPGEIPDDETPAPWLYYAVPSTTDLGELDDDQQPVVSQVEFHALADTYATAKAILDAVYAALNGYYGGQVSRALWGETTEETTEYGYHHSNRFTVWWSIVTIIATPGSNARITTGANTITLTAGGHTLTLGSSGLALDGVGLLTGDAAALDFSNLPTSDPFQAGKLWVDGETVKLSSGVWSPAALSPDLWLDALGSYSFTDAGQTVPAGAGAQVYVGADRSGHADHAVQATSGSRPTKRSNGWEFDTTADHLLLTTPVALMTADFTLYVAGSVAAANVGWHPLGSSATAFVITCPGDGNLYVVDDSGGSVVSIAAGFTGAVLLRIRRVGGTVYVNWTGKAGGESAIGTAVANYTPGAVGARVSASVWNGSTSNRIAGVLLVARDLTGTERTAAEAYYAGLGYTL